MKHSLLRHCAVLAFLAFAVPCSAMGDFWVRASGPSGGLIWAMAVDSVGIVLAGTDKAGIFRSTDRGQSWTPVNTGLGSLSIYDLAFHRSGTWFASTWAGAALYRSTNQGNTWTPANSGLALSTVEALGCRDTYVYAAGYYGVRLSSDTGKTWTDISSTLTGLVIKAFAVEPAGGLLAGTARGIFHTTNGGTSWEQRNTGLSSDTSVNQIAVAPGGEILVATSRNQGIYRSTDHGLTWTKKSTGIPNGYFAGLMISPDGTGFASVQHAGLYRSTDLGDSWSPVSAGLLQKDIRAMSFSRQGDLYAGEYGEGVSRSTDGGLTWTVGIQGMSASNVAALAHSASGVLFAGTDGSGVHRSTDGGHTWLKASTGLTNVEVRAVAVSPGNVVYAGTFGGGVFRSDDDGTTWSPKQDGMGNTDVLGLLLLGPDSVLAGCRNTGVFLSTDRGDHWIASNAGFTGNKTAACLARIEGRKIVAGTWSTGTYISSDGGANWQQSDSGLTTKDVRAILVKSPDLLFAGTNGGGIFRSTDGGVTWQSANTGNENFCYAIACAPGGTLYSGGGSSTRLSTNNGDSWAINDAGMGSAQVSSFDIGPNGTLLSGTYGLGVFYSASPVAVREEGEAPVPVAPELQQNYPNPFNGMSDIGFRISDWTYVELRVFDLLGREVAVLVDAYTAPGTYHIRFDGSTLATGVYVYWMQAGAYGASRKMVLAR